MTVPLPLSEWRKIGVRTIAGGALPANDTLASLVSGVKRHFLVYSNYQALLEYNCVNAYGLSVGLLGDQAAKAPKASTKPAKRTPAKKKKKGR
jgi:membrane-bound lytic murein transglycosylase B